MFAEYYTLGYVHGRKKAYADGYKKGKEDGATIPTIDDYVPSTGVVIDIPQEDPDGQPNTNGDGGYDIDGNGVIFYIGELTVDGHTGSYYLHISFDSYYEDTSVDTIVSYRQGRIVGHLYSTDGVISKSETKWTTSGWGYVMDSQYPTLTPPEELRTLVYRIEIVDNKVITYHREFHFIDGQVQSNTSEYTQTTPFYLDIGNALSHASTVQNLPPNLYN